MDDEQRKKFGKKVWRAGGSWTRVRAANRVDQIASLWTTEEARDELRFYTDWVQSLINGMLHGGPQALAAATNRHGEGWRIRTREDGYFVRQSSLCAIWAFGQTVTLLMDEWDLPGLNEPFMEAYAAAHAAFD